jgi:hypothetical protein
MNDNLSKTPTLDSLRKGSWCHKVGLPPSLGFAVGEELFWNDVEQQWIRAVMSPDVEMRDGRLYHKRLKAYAALVIDTDELTPKSMKIVPTSHDWTDSAAQCKSPHH